MTTAIDASLVTELVNLVKSVAGLFSIFPINILIIGMLGGVAFGWFRKAKKVAR